MQHNLETDKEAVHWFSDKAMWVIPWFYNSTGIGWVFQDAACQREHYDKPCFFGVQGQWWTRNECLCGIDYRCWRCRTSDFKEASIINGNFRILNWRYLPYIRPIEGLCNIVREYTHKIWPYMVQYLHFRILEWPLTLVCHQTNRLIPSPVHIRHPPELPWLSRQWNHLFGTI